MKKPLIWSLLGLLITIDGCKHDVTNVTNPIVPAETWTDTGIRLPPTSPVDVHATDDRLVLASNDQFVVIDKNSTVIRQQSLTSVKPLYYPKPGVSRDYVALWGEGDNDPYNLFKAALSIYAVNQTNIAPLRLNINDLIKLEAGYNELVAGGKGGQSMSIDDDGNLLLIFTAIKVNASDDQYVHLYKYRISVSADNTLQLQPIGDLALKPSNGKEGFATNDFSIQQIAGQTYFHFYISSSLGLPDHLLYRINFQGADQPLTPTANVDYVSNLFDYNNQLYAALSANGKQQLWMSPDQGTSWSQVTTINMLGGLFGSDADFFAGNLLTDYPTLVSKPINSPYALYKTDLTAKSDTLSSQGLSKNSSLNLITRFAGKYYVLLNTGQGQIYTSAHPYPYKKL